MNLYVKNIADTVSDEQFKEAFGVYGAITSARIMRDRNDGKTSKGFGFVCFTTQEAAAKAVAEMNGKPLAGKPLVVTLYQRIEQRRAQLAANFAPQGMRFPAGMPGAMPMPFPMYQPAFPGQPPRGAPMPFAYPNMPRGMGNSPRGMPYNAGNRGGFMPAAPQYMQPGQQPSKSLLSVLFSL
jgi:polyadenylate-binding protein